MCGNEFIYLFFFYSISLSIDSFSLSIETIWSSLSFLFDVEVLCFIIDNLRRGINRRLPSQFLINEKTKENN